MRTSSLRRLPLIARLAVVAAVVLAWGLVVSPAFAAVQGPGSASTHVIIAPVAPVTVGDKITVSAQLTTDSAAFAGALDNEQLQVWIDGQLSRRLRTDEQGRAEIYIAPGLGVGSHALRIVYPGSSDLAASEAESQLVVQPATLVVKVVPPLKGIAFSLSDRWFASGPDGMASVVVDTPGTYRLKVLTTDMTVGDTHATFDRWRDDEFDVARDVQIPTDEPIQIGFDVSHRISWSYVDLDGNPVDPARVTSVTVKGTHGVTHVFDEYKPQWLLASRVLRTQDGLNEAKIQWGVESVTVDGANTVNRGQHRFYVNAGDRWTVRLLLYTAHFAARDAFFGFPVGSGFNLEYPDGKVQFFPAGPASRVTAAALARGQYKVGVADAPGLAPAAPVALTRRQDVQLKVITYFDLAFAGVALGSVGLGLLFFGRPHLIAWVPTPWRHKNGRMAPVWTTGLLLLLLIGVPALAGSYLLTVRSGQTADSAGNHISVPAQGGYDAATGPDTAGKTSVQRQIEPARLTGPLNGPTPVSPPAPGNHGGAAAIGVGPLLRAAGTEREVRP